MQAARCLEIIDRALRDLGTDRSRVVRTRMCVDGVVVSCAVIRGALCQVRDGHQPVGGVRARARGVLWAGHAVHEHGGGPRADRPRDAD